MRPPAIGMTSAVVLPTSMSSASGCSPATASAVATQLAAATSHGRARAASTDMSSPAVVSTLRAVAERVLGGVEHERHALALGAERVGQLGGHRDRHGVGRTRRRSRAARRRALRGRARPRRDATPSAATSRGARRPSCSRRRCPPLAWPACASSESSISRPARRSTPCAASANAIARSATRSRSRAGSGSTSCTSPTSTRSPAEACRTRSSPALAREARVMVDAGVSEPERARALLDLGVHRVVVGTETLTDADALDRLPDAVLSVDLRDGRTLSRDPRLAGLPALDAVALLHRAGLREVIVLDLARVGSGAGPDVEAIAEIHAAFPELELLAGGGVRDADDLRALADAGAAGALVATALLKALSDTDGVHRAARAFADRPPPNVLRPSARPPPPRRRVASLHRLHVAEPGIAVELQHVQPGSVGSRPAGRRPRSRRPAPRPPPGTGAPARRSARSARALGAAREVRPPPRADPLDRREHPPADDERPQVTLGRAAAPPAGSRRRARAPARGRRGTRRRDRRRASSRRPSSRTAA